MKVIPETPNNDLSLEDFKGIKNTKEDRARFLEYPDSTLNELELEAALERKYEIAAIIRDVLEDKAKKVNSPIESSNQAQKQLLDVMSMDDDDPVKTDGEFINLWKKQQEFSKKIENYFEEHKIRNVDGTKKTVNSKDISFYNDTIFVNNTRDNHIFKQGNGGIEEIPLIQDEVPENRRIRDIYRIGDYYLVVVCCTNKDGSVIYNNGKEESLRFVIDEDGNYLPELGYQDGEGHFSFNKGMYEYNKNLGNGEVTRTIFNKNMEKIAEFKDRESWREQKHNILYCDNNVCVCFLKDEGLYEVYSNSQIVGKGTKKDLEQIDHMQGFWEHEKEKEQANNEYNRFNSIPFEERFMYKNHCKIVYKNNEKSTISIENDKGKSIFSVSNIKRISGYGNKIPTFYTNNGDIIELNEWESESNILFIRIKNSQTNNNEKSIFINKETGKKKVFTGFEGRSSSPAGNLILSFYNNNCAKIYDNNMEYIGDYDTRYSNYGNNGFTYIKRKEKNGEFKYFIASNKSGKIITEYDGEEDLACYRGDNNTLYLIVNIPGKGLAQVKIEQ